LRRDGKLEGVLLGQDRDATFRVSCPGCTPSGWATIIENPLHSLPLEDKLLVVLRSDKQEWAQAGPDARRLLVLFNNKRNTENLASASPRAELTLLRLPAKD